MIDQQIIDRLVNAVDKFTSLKDFRLGTSRTEEDHKHYRAGLYQEMTEALKAYNEAVKP
jgi:hypothetical protein